ncbi:MAG: phosphoribosyl-AMP cyclohydrolase [Sphingobacteriia bacterium]|nr:phosphoribosyl-AMP cyclohydrolase [Sphingobacteriia bacterium]
MKAKNQITIEEVLNFQQLWGESLVYIGNVYSEGGDYHEAAIRHITVFYGYHSGTVLFKPTMASVRQFRTDEAGALSYFAGGNPDYPEDSGFALKPWKSVRWENAGIKLLKNLALIMGNYYFTPADGNNETKVEFSICLEKDKKGNLRIILHDSHLPFLR